MKQRKEAFHEVTAFGFPVVMGTMMALVSGEALVLNSGVYWDELLNNMPIQHALSCPNISYLALSLL
jgi:hypothetical protein